MVPGCLLLTLLSPLPPLPHPIRRRRCVRPRRYGRTAVDRVDAGRACQDRGVSARNLTPHSTPEPYPLNPVPLSLFSQILNPDPCAPPPRCTTIVLATPPLSLGESRKPDPCLLLPTPSGAPPSYWPPPRAPTEPSHPRCCTAPRRRELRIFSRRGARRCDGGGGERIGKGES